MSTPLSARAVQSLGVFGLTTRDLAHDRSTRTRHAATGAAALHAALPPGAIALVTGPSGAGKTSLLHALASRLSDRSGTPIHAGSLLARARRRPFARVIDTFDPPTGDPHQPLSVLSAAGLADAFIPARPVRSLSVGEQARLAIALALHAAGNAPSPATILVDEFAASLDEATARAVCSALRRWTTDHPACRVVAAGARCDLLSWLRPDLLVEVGIDGRGRIRTHAAPPPPSDINIAPATPAEYAALAHLHYRAGRPATIARVLAARHADALIGVLTVSMPTLNGAWRALAWPGRYADARASKSAAARRLNREVRCISRVIVDPRWRSRGVGVALVRAYLSHPLTSRTEAVSAMGVGCPIFTRAGMRDCTPPRSTRDLRLIDALDAADLRPWMLADIDLITATAARFPHLEPALRTWARAHGPTRRLAGAPIDDLIRAAARTVIHRPRAYAFDEDPRARSPSSAAHAPPSVTPHAVGE